MSEVRGFKVRPEENDHRAWCTACSWSRTGKPRRGGSTSSPAVTAARTHTRETGHETRIDMTAQRGFKLA